MLSANPATAAVAAAPPVAGHYLPAPQILAALATLVELARGCYARAVNAFESRALYSSAAGDSVVSQWAWSVIAPLRTSSAAACAR